MSCSMGPLEHISKSVCPSLSLATSLSPCLSRWLPLSLSLSLSLTLSFVCVCVSFSLSSLRYHSLYTYILHIQVTYIRIKFSVCACVCTYIHTCIHRGCESDWDLIWSKGCCSYLCMEAHLVQTSSRHASRGKYALRLYAIFSAGWKVHGRSRKSLRLDAIFSAGLRVHGRLRKSMC